MLQTGKKDPVAKKAYEIAYALCRIGDSIKNDTFGKVLTQKGIELLCVASDLKNGAIAGFVSRLEYIIQFGANVGYLGQSNGNTLLAECAELLNAVAGEEIDREDVPRHIEPDVDVSDIFSPSLDVAVGNDSSDSMNADIDITFGAEEKEKWFNKKGIRIIESEPVQSPEVEKDISREFAPLKEGINTSNSQGAESRFSVSAEMLQRTQSEDEVNEKEDVSNGGFSTSISSDIRQSTILNRIRQSGNCRIRDLQDLFPRWSERTLRYDIESLMSRKLVERVGAGSATYYQPVVGESGKA